MNKEEQIKIINDAIIQTKTSLKPLGYNLLFWGILIISMSLFQYFLGGNLSKSTFICGLGPTIDMLPIITLKMELR